MTAKKEPKATLDEHRDTLRILALAYADHGKNCDIPVAQQAEMMAMWKVIIGYADFGRPGEVKVLHDFWVQVADQIELMKSLFDAFNGSPPSLQHVTDHAVRRLKSGKPSRWDGWNEYIRDLCGCEVTKEVKEQVVLAVIDGAIIKLPTHDGRMYGGLWQVIYPRLGQPGAVEFVYGDAIHHLAAVEQAP